MKKNIIRNILLLFFVAILIGNGTLVLATSDKVSIGIKPYFNPGEEIRDAVALRYKTRINKNESFIGKILFGGKRFYAPDSIDSYLLESNIYTNWAPYTDTGCQPWPPNHPSIARNGEGGLWLSVPDYHYRHSSPAKRARVGVRPVDENSRRMFPRTTTGIDHIIDVDSNTGETFPLTKIETISQMNMNGKDIEIEYRRGGTFTAPLDGFGYRFKGKKDARFIGRPSAPPEERDYAIECASDLPPATYRIWNADVRIDNVNYKLEFALPNESAQYFAPWEISSFLTEFFGNNSQLFQVYIWDVQVQRENDSQWKTLRRWQVFYNSSYDHGDPQRKIVANVTHGPKLSTYNGRPVIEFSNDGTDTYYKFRDTFEISALVPDDELTLTKNLETLSIGWDQNAVDSANVILTKPSYTSTDWEGFFEKYFNTQRHPLTDQLQNYLEYPLFGWFDDSIHLKLQKGLLNPLWNKINTLMTLHNSTLGSDMKRDENLAKTLINSHRIIHHMIDNLFKGQKTVLSDADRDSIFNSYKTLINSYPQHMKAGAINISLSPIVPILRTQVWMNFRDTKPLDSTIKNEIAQTIGLQGKYADLWNSHSLLLHDNNGFDDQQINKIKELLSLIPLDTQLGGITQNDSLGNINPFYFFVGKAVNIFKTKIGSEPENPFPEDISPWFSEIFTGALGHEAHHMIDTFHIGNIPVMKARKEELLRQAGTNPMQYLRSMFVEQDGTSYFTKAPQEFTASISNQWSADSGHTIDLGILRFEKGHKEPINQALFFVELYSRGGLTSRFYRTNKMGEISTQEIPIIRDGNGRITGLTYAGKDYRFTLDNRGNVTAFTINKINPVISSFTSDANNIDNGSSTTLRWSTTNASSCRGKRGTSLWEGDKPVNGSFNTGTLKKNTKFNLICKNVDNAEARNSLIISVKKK